MPYLWAQKTNSHTTDLDGGIIQKIKNVYRTLPNTQQLKKVQRKYINICLNNKKNKILDRHGV